MVSSDPPFSRTNMEGRDDKDSKFSRLQTTNTSVVLQHTSVVLQHTTCSKANYISMLCGKVIPVLKKKRKLNSCIFQHCSFESLAWLREYFGKIDLKESRVQLTSLQP